MSKYDVVVVGGGAAGLIAAWRAAILGASVLLLEKKNRLGTKILISGGGKCNLTHAGTMDEVRARFRSNEGRFLRPSFYRFTNDDFLQLLTTRGMEVYTRPDGRIFPVPPFDAKDVAVVLEAHLRDAGVQIALETPVAALKHTQGKICGVTLGNGEFLSADRLVVAVGGSSYPATGTTGDGWRWLQEAGHSIVTPRAALAPLYLEPTPPDEWSGVALRDCILKARRGTETGQIGREVMRWRGDLLWTHKGVSGPTALGVSREIAERIPEKSVLEADLLPDETDEQVAQRLLLWTKESPRRNVESFADGLLPQRLLAPLFESAQVDMLTKGAYLTQKERNRLVQTLKNWPLGMVRAVPLERGEVVAGGVALDEVDEKTMRSRRISGLYLCGEVLDIAGPVGGYNLQAAWSTGFVAGDTAAHDAKIVQENEIPNNKRSPT